jgi:hypothetical protein
MLLDIEDFVLFLLETQMRNVKCAVSIEPSIA